MPNHLQQNENRVQIRPLQDIRISTIIVIKFSIYRKFSFPRVVGKFKGAIKAYRLPLPRDLDDHTVMGHDPQTGGFFQVVLQIRMGFI